METYVKRILASSPYAWRVILVLLLSGVALLLLGVLSQAYALTINAAGPASEVVASDMPAVAAASNPGLRVSAR